MLDLERVAHVVAHAEMRIERVLLEDERDIAILRLQPDDALAVDPDVAVIRLLETGEHPQRRRLAATARAEQDEQLAVVRRERQVLHRGRRLPGKLLPDRVELDRRHASYRPRVVLIRPRTIILRVAKKSSMTGST